MSGNASDRRFTRRHMDAPADFEAEAERLAATEGPIDLDSAAGISAVFKRGARRQREREEFHARLAVKLKKVERKNRYYAAAVGLTMGVLIYLVFFTG